MSTPVDTDQAAEASTSTADLDAALAVAGVVGRAPRPARGHTDHAFQSVDHLGFELDEADAQNAFRRCKGRADRKGFVTSADVAASVCSEKHVKAADDFELVSLEVSGGTVAPSRATVGIRLADAEMATAVGEEPGSVVTATETGDGMVDAASGAIRHAVGRDEVTPISFQVTAASGGIDALGEVTVTVVEVEDEQRFTGRGVPTDIVEASARSDVDALNRSRRLVHRSPEFKP